MKTFKELMEGLKIVKKNWKFTHPDNYKVEINDTESHSILDRIKERVNPEIKLNDINPLLQKGVDLIIKKNEKGFFKKDISFIELTYKKSKFKAIIMIKSKTNYIRISSIFEINFKTENALIWDINEFYKELPEYSNITLNESVGFYILEDYFCFERNKDNIQVFLADINDVYSLELNN